MKKKLCNVANLFIVVTIILSGIIGLQERADASAVDTDFSIGYTMEGYTDFRVKDGTSKVYVYPINGPSRWFQVQGRIDLNDSTIMDCSSNCLLNTGTKYSFTNYVRENGRNMARLKVTSTYYLPATTTGKWSPDSIGTYTIVPQP